MRALFDQLTAAQHQNPIRGFHRGQAMGDHHSRAFLQQPIQVALQGGLCGGIHEGGGLVHHQHRGVTDRHPCHRQQLTFTGREIAATLPQLCLQPIRQPLQQVVQAQITADSSQLLIADLGIEPKVIGHVAAEQEGVLQHHPQLTSQIGDRNRTNVTTIQKNPALLRFIQPAEQPDDGGFSRPRRSHQGHVLARSNAEGEVAQDRLIRPIAEADVLENHLPQAGRTQRSGVGILHDLQGLLHQLTDALHGRQTTLNLGEPFRQLTQRIKQTLGIEDEGGEDSKAHGT